MIKKFTRKINEQEIFLELLKPGELDLSAIHPVTQISGLCYDNKNNILILSSKPDKWFIPGGKPEAGENFEDTLKREVFEEASVEIEDIQPIAFLRINFPNNPNKTEGDIFFQGRFIAKIKDVESIKIDPATGLTFERKFVSIDNFSQYVRWDDADTLISLLKEKLKL